ncbi:MAG: hypothetical protein IPM74_14645 [Crocinitomicaceae bacterium]|nr:hypothetical protein [Crocinitomicaceae bacterium]MBK8927109.1 hypothetical protein [Crocinitomicaceae bacterium]
MRLYCILFFILLIAVSCNQNSSDTAEFVDASSSMLDDSANILPEFDEIELIKLFHETERNGTKEPHYQHSGEDRFQISNSTFDELLIEYDQTNLQIQGDSLASFIIKSTSILEPEQRIVYDFGAQPGNYGDLKITGASYSRLQFYERWYYEEIGFD